MSYTRSACVCACASARKCIYLYIYMCVCVCISFSFVVMLPVLFALLHVCSVAFCASYRSRTRNPQPDKVSHCVQLCGTLKSFTKHCEKLKHLDCARPAVFGAWCLHPTTGTREMGVEMKSRPHVLNQDGHKHCDRMSYVVDSHPKPYTSCTD